MANVQALEEAVRVGSEHLQIGAQSTTRHESRVATYDVEELEPIQAKPVVVDTKKQMLEALSRLTEKVDQLESRLSKEQKQLLSCFECGEQGHFRSKCPRRKKQGKELGPRN